MKSSKHKKFLFGFASSGYHIEGNNTTSDWYFYEKKKFRKQKEHINGISNDYWNRWEEDHDLLEESGVDVWKTSIEWSRVEPVEGGIDYDSVKKYKDIFADLKKRKIKLCLSFFHFVSPRWFAKKGGFEYKENLPYFQKYAEFILEEFGEYIDMITPINEIVTLPYQGYTLGLWPPKRTNFFAALGCVRNLIKAHFIVAELIRTKRLKVKLGTSEHARYILFIQKNPFTRILQFYVNYVGNYVVTKSIVKNKLFFPLSLRGIRVTDKEHKGLDFIGIQYYNIVAAKLIRVGIFPRVVNTFTSSNAWKTDFTFQDSYQGQPLGEIAPDYIEKFLKRIRSYTSKDIVITESGISTHADKSKTKYLKVHIEKIKELREKGYKIGGFFYFTLCDSFEWAEGFTQHFGLVKIDRKNNLKRIKRPSFNYYKKLIKEF